MDVGAIGVFTAQEVDGGATSVEAMIEQVKGTVAPVIKDGKMPVLIGGDHVVALGAISALVGAKAEFDVLHFDAHSGTRDAYEGNRYAHECTAARIREISSCYSIDVRSGDMEGMKKFTADILTTSEMKEIRLENSVKRMARKTGRLVYLSFNYDFMSISDMPSVRTTEPGGLSYGKTIDMLAQLVINKTVVGMDFVGLSPIDGLNAPNVVAAKLIQKTLCSIFKEQHE